MNAEIFNKEHVESLSDEELVREFRRLASKNNECDCRESLFGHEKELLRRLLAKQNAKDRDDS